MDRKTKLSGQWAKHNWLQLSVLLCCLMLHDNGYLISISMISLVGAGQMIRNCYLTFSDFFI